MDYTPGMMSGGIVTNTGQSGRGTLLLETFLDRSTEEILGSLEEFMPTLVSTDEENADLFDVRPNAAEQQGTNPEEDARPSTDEIVADTDSDCDEESSSEDSDSDTDDDDVNSKDVGNWSTPASEYRPTIHKFTGPSPGRNPPVEYVPHTRPSDYFKLIFNSEVFEFLVEETNKYHSQMAGGRPTSSSHIVTWQDVTVQDLMKFIAVIIIMGHDRRDSIRDYWSTQSFLDTPHYQHTIPRDRFLQILRFLHFSDNQDKPDASDPGYDSFWKFRRMFELLNSRFKDVYNPEEHLSIHKMNVFCQEPGASHQSVSRNRKHLSIKFYKICDGNAYTIHMKDHLGKTKGNTSDGRSSIHRLVTEVTTGIKNRGHKLYMNDYFSSPDLFDELHRKGINCCGMVEKYKVLRRNVLPTRWKLRKGNSIVRVRNGLLLLRWRGKKELYFLTNFQDPPKQGQQLNKDAAIKPVIIQNYDAHMENVLDNDLMINAHTLRYKHWKWTKKLFLHLLDIAISNAFVLYRRDGRTDMNHRAFRKQIAFELIEFVQGLQGVVATDPSLSKRSTGCKEKVSRLEAKSSNHWPKKLVKRRRCAACRLRKIYKVTWFLCEECNVGLCIEGCFKKYHTQAEMETE